MKWLGVFIVCVHVTLVLPAIAQGPAVDPVEFQGWIFGEIGRPEMPLSFLEEQIELQISRISSSIDLSDDQISHLRLAGRGDVKRFYDRMEQVRRHVVALSQEQKDDGSAHRLTMPLRKELRKGLFGGGSLFQKVVVTSLDDQQSAVLQRHLSRLNQLQTEIAVRTFVAKIGCYLPLTSVQRTKLTDVLLENVDSVGGDSNYRFHIVLYRFSCVPRQQYETFFDENQMQMIVELTRAGLEIGEHLKQEGEIDDE